VASIQHSGRRGIHSGICRALLRAGVAIDRTSKFAYAELLPKYGKLEAAQFLRNLIAVVPYKIHTVLTEQWHPVHPSQNGQICLFA